jgi:hypothetical protein
MVVQVIFLLVASTLVAEVKKRTLAGKTFQLEEVFYEGFRGDLSNWQVEGDARVRLYGGFMEVNAIEELTETDVGASTIWCNKEFEGPQLVEYDVRLMGDTIFTNINMFLMASMPDGPGVLETSAERNGNFRQYHTFPNYLVTIINQNSPLEKRQKLRIRMRLNPGFELESECWQAPLVIGKLHHVAYIIDPPEVSVLVDDKPVCRNSYATALTRGLHGLRIYHTHSLYGNFRVSRILK